MNQNDERHRNGTRQRIIGFAGIAAWTAFTIFLFGATATTAFASDTTFVLDASVHGSPSFDFPPLLIPVTAGIYECTLVDSINGAPSGAQAWSFAFGNSGTWRTTYECRLEGGTVYTGGEATESDSAEEAFAQTDEKTIVIEVPVNQTLRFNIADNKVSDNAGGVTLRLCKMAPTATDRSSWSEVKTLFR